MKTLALRWLKFNGVGAIGIVVQLVCLKLLVDGFHVHYEWATAVAVETAVLHNFAWHERFTWKDRAGGSMRDRLMRLLRFQLGNGLVSLVGNVAIMRLLVGVLHMKSVMIANGIAIAGCSIVNFAAGEWFVFRRPAGMR